jgi:hypothetical protein
MNSQTSPTKQEEEKPNTVYYANVYATGRAYGGPEEGGWHYTVFTYLNVAAVGLEKATVEEAARDYRLQLMIDCKEKTGPYRMGHGPHDGADPDGNGDDTYLIKGGVWGRDQIKIWVEDHPGKSGPTNAPHYE